jgi:hypothetical protein
MELQPQRSFSHPHVRNWSSAIRLGSIGSRPAGDLKRRIAWFAMHRRSVVRLTEEPQFGFPVEASYRRRLVMKLATILILGSLAIGSAARADQPGPDWMPMEQVKAKIMESGYSQVTKLEADDGQWEGEGVKNGQKMEFHADPKTGVITREKPDR